MKRILICLTFIILCLACDKDQNIETFDSEKAYIYFSQPNPIVTTNTVEKYINNIDFSFVFEDVNLREKTIAIPLNIIGVSKSYDRPVSVKIDTANSTINLADIEVLEADIHAGKSVDSLYISVKKTDALLENVYYLGLELQDNEHFKIGHSSNKNFTISITNMLTAPTWWTAWQPYFGPYYQEVFQKWMQLYYEGVDPSPIVGSNPNNELYYYWNNMPAGRTQATYPVTFMYIAKLREYFEKNTVYPNGDSTKPRIVLP